MMQLNGKLFYRIDDVTKELGYTKGTLQNYISAGVCEAERMEDGEWLITEAGMVALRRRKKMNPSHTEETVGTSPSEIHQGTTSSKEQSKTETKKHNPANFKEGCLYIRKEEDRQKYEVLKQAAEITGLTIGDMSMVAVRHYVDTVLSGKIEELKKIECQKNKILAGIA